jgi:hypothetical protein
MLFIGELPKQFIESIRKDLTRITDSSWGEYQAEVLRECSWIEQIWVRHQVKKLNVERLKVIGATLELDKEAGEDMLGMPSYARSSVKMSTGTRVPPPSPIPIGLTTPGGYYNAQQAQMNAQHGLLQAQAAQAAAGLLGGKP